MSKEAIYFPEMPKWDYVEGSKKLIRITHDYYGPVIDGKQTVVKAGFICDGASIPKWAWWLIAHPFQAPFIAFAIPHDGEYAGELFERDECDYRLKCACNQLPIKKFKKWLIYRAVRIGGKSPWNKHTDESIADAMKFVSVIEVKT